MPKPRFYPSQFARYALYYCVGRTLRKAFLCGADDFQVNAVLAWLACLAIIKNGTSIHLPGARWRLLMLTGCAQILREVVGIIVANRQMPGTAFAERRMDAG